MATGILERRGFKKARNLEGGSRAWIEADLPVYEGEKTAATGLIPVKATPEGPSSMKSGKKADSAPKAKRTPKPKIPDEGC
jgi:3-mercaptopyruvate sulfurtransferase SseA